MTTPVSATPRPVNLPSNPTALLPPSPAARPSPLAPPVPVALPALSFGPHFLPSALALATTLILAVALGRLAARIRLPAIVGFLVAGVLLGPSVAGLLTPPTLEALSPLSHLGLGLIGVAAGAELPFTRLSGASGRFTVRLVLYTQLFSHLAVLGTVLPALACFPALFDTLRDSTSTATAAAVGDHSDQSNLHLHLSSSLPPSRPSWSTVIPLVSLAGVIMGARSPATAVAVINEAKAAGPYTQTIMAITVVKDVSVILLFAFHITTQQRFTALLEAPSWLGQLGALVALAGGPLLEVGVATVVGAIMSAFLPDVLVRVAGVQSHSGYYAPLETSTDPSASTSTSRPRWSWLSSSWPWMGTVVLVATTAMAWHGTELLGGDGLVACVMVGLCTNNPGLLDPRGALGWISSRLVSSIHPVNRISTTTKDANDEEVFREHQVHALHEPLRWFMPVVHVAFFSLVGAGIRVGRLRGPLLGLGLAVAVTRMVALWLVSRVARRVPNLSLTPEQARQLWKGLVTQAGVALGLVRTAEMRLGGGEGGGSWVGSLLTPTILLNLLVGPVLFRHALGAVHEVGMSTRGVEEVELADVGRMISTSDTTSRKGEIRKVVGGGGGVYTNQEIGTSATTKGMGSETEPWRGANKKGHDPPVAARPTSP